MLDSTDAASDVVRRVLRSEYWRGAGQLATMSSALAYKYGGKHSLECVCPSCGFHGGRHSFG